MPVTATRWFNLSGREVRVLVVAAGVILLGVLAAKGLRAALRPSDLTVENAREALSTPARLDVNTALAHELQLVPGIGEKTAQAIVASREQEGPFRSLADLDRVPGIGSRTIERLRPHLMCVPPEEGQE